MKRHAKLSPSAAHRWMRCTASPSFEEAFPDTASEYADEGTLAHALCAKRLKESLGQSTADEDAEIAELWGLHGSGEMREHADEYFMLVTEKLAKSRQIASDALLRVEAPLDFSEWIPEGFGTADAMIIEPGAVEVIDFKYGKGVRVSAESNPQMMIYALGALDLYGCEYAIDKVRLTIVQPRLDSVSEWETTADGLRAWAAGTLAPKAAEAYGDGGKFAPGEWCRFCRGKRECKALAEHAVGAWRSAPDPRKVSKEQMERDILPSLPAIKAWLADIEDYALEQALGGVAYQGYKVVAGRSARAYSDRDAIASALAGAGYKAADIYKPMELKGIGEMEKLCGKKRFAELCGQWLSKPMGKPTLVPESDKRQAYSSAAADFEGINE